MLINHKILVSHNLEQLGKAIHYVRDSQNLNLFSCAKRLGIPYQKLDRIEIGKVKNFDLTLLFKFAKLTNTKIKISLEEYDIEI